MQCAGDFVVGRLPTLCQCARVVKPTNFHGPASASNFAAAIAQCKTVFWNGPMGVFEFENFSHGTKTIAKALTQVDGMAVVGGGDSAAAVRKLGFADNEFSYISTGGGASLEYLEGKDLPGLVALSK